MANYRKLIRSFIQKNLAWQASNFLPKVTRLHYIRWVVIAVTVILVLAYFFYKSVWGCIALLPWAVVLTVIQREFWKTSVRRQIETDFKEWLYHLRSELAAGYSMEHAIARAEYSVHKVLPDTSYLWLGLQEIMKALSLHLPIEVVLSDFGRESQIATIEDFAITYQIAKKQGYQMSKVLDKTITSICERIAIRAEIEIIVKGKELEQKIMCVIPFFILVYVGQMGAGYFDMLYHNWSGICIMTVCLIVYSVSVCWGVYIVKSTDGYS